MQRCLTVLLLLVLAVTGVWAQTAPFPALRENTPNVFAFTNATIVVAPGNIIAKGTLVVRNGTIQAVGANVQPPADARVIDMTGSTLYAGLIELSSDIGVPKPPQPQPGQQQAGGGGGQQPQQEPLKGSAHWNPKVRAEYDIAGEFSPDRTTAEKLRSQGFTLALATPVRGIFRGSSALVQLGDGAAGELIVKRNVVQNVIAEVGPGFGGGQYPGSLMGTIAFIRQTWNDADWYRKAWDSYNKNPNQRRPETNNSLAALQDALQRRQPVVTAADDEFAFLRAAKMGKEFSLNLIVRGSGSEYRRIDAIKATKLPVVVPLNFPETPSVDTPEEAANASVEDLRHWDAAPENAGRLEKAGVPMALTSATLKDAGTFLAQVRKAIERGLSSDAALAALTTTPAKWLGVDKSFGTLEAGKVANIVVTDGDLFGEKTKIREVWVDGNQYEVKPPPAADARGTWDLKISLSPNEPSTLTLSGDIEKPTGSITGRGKTMRLNSATFAAGRIAFTLNADSIGVKGTTQMSGSVSASEIYGVGNRPDGMPFSWSATRTEPAKAEADTAKPKKPEMASFPDMFPPGEYGRAKQPDQPANILVKNATVWTQGPQGKLESTDMLITRGKIARIGKNLQAPADAVVVDATGKHVTPGMIDAHSHTAVAGAVNEGAQNVTIETRIEDVIDSEDIWIYRQLAGGTTAANILHGSANPIGGQNATVKWRWGSLPDELLLTGAPAGVKFALGENVKSSAALVQLAQVPYPTTRRGVEQIIRDAFKAARDYERAWKALELDKTKIPPRKDTELDALLEILTGKRLVHCHSYRQDEILMMIRIADDFGFRIATFQHVLEGYKVADAMAKHGAGGSTFSDWWAYKIEAWDAIPGNGPLMASQGVLVSYNSDNSQLATRLNWEAAKAIPFGMSEEEALKFVTINPAKQLGIADKVGSLEVGKDADIAIWNGNPLSTYTKCVQTWVDGRRYFDLDEDNQLRQEIQNERATLIQKILASKNAASPSPATRQA
ncbi:MAG TPA: amidohydrolase family protein, partial [Bacteroidota bacterium]